MNRTDMIKWFRTGLSAILFCGLPTMVIAAEKPIYQYYSVYGKDFNSIEQSMKENRPNNANSGNEWHIGWKFSFGQHQGLCYLIEPSVTKKVIIILPRWENISEGDDAMQKEWMRYTKALKTHQLGHIKFSDEAQAAILKMFKSFEPMSKCRTVKSNANKEAHDILKLFYDKDAAYEKLTEHGATQGAQLREP